MEAGDKFIAEVTWQRCFGGPCEVNEYEEGIEVEGYTHSNELEVFGMRGKVGSKTSEKRRDTFFIEGIRLSKNGVWVTGADLDEGLDKLHLARDYTPSF